jgi:histidinol-phosphate/aromatic aminotransferase/cobyric acid decarboxylase-like protein
VAEGRRQFTGGLAANPAITLCGGTANFFFASPGEGIAFGHLSGYLLSRGILVRDCSNFEGVPPASFRFCIRNPEENLRLVSALNDFATDAQNATVSLREGV